MVEGHRGPLLLILGVVALVYGNSLDNSFHFDDQHSLVENPHLRHLGNLPDFFIRPQMFSRNVGSEMYRPLLLVTYGFNYAFNKKLGLDGYDVRSFHLVNIALHLGVAWLLYGVVLHLGAAKGGALLSALFFAAHPLNAEPVNYISSRSESLAALFYLAGFFLYLRSSRPISPLSILCFAGGLLSKSTAITLPALLLVYEWAFRPERTRHCWRWHWPYWVIAGGYLWGTRRLIHEALGAAPVRSWMAQVSTQVKALLYYAKLMVLPWPLSVEHQFFESGSLREGTVALVLVLGVSLVLVARPWTRGQGREGLFWLGWMVIVLLPTLVIPLNVLVNERRLYLPLVGLAGLLVWLLRTAPGKRYFYGLAGVGLLCLGGLTWQRNPVWQDETTLWQDAQKKAPLMPRPHLRMGIQHRQAGRLKEAEAAFRHTLELDPENAAAFNNLGNLAEGRGDHQAAVQAYGKALQLRPGYAEALINLATLYSAQGRLDQALGLYQKALPVSRNREEIYNNLGTTYLKMDRFDQAEKALRQALALSRGRPGILFNLGGALEGQGRVAEAIQAYQQALQLDETYPKPYYNLGLLYEQTGQSEVAIRAYEGFLEYWKGDPDYAVQVRRRLQRLEAGAP